MRKLATRLVVVMATCAAMSIVGVGQEKVDLTGKWQFNVQTDAGAGTPTFTLKQEGDKLTGHYVGTFGEAEVAGTVKGREFTIQYSADAQGTKVDVTYKGTVESKDAVKGTVSIAGLGEGTFTGKRQ